MYETARMLLTLSSRWLLALILIALVACGALGYYVSLWIPTIAFGLLLLMIYLMIGYYLRQVAEHARAKGVVPTAEALYESILAVRLDDTSNPVKRQELHADIKAFRESRERRLKDMELLAHMKGAAMSPVVDFDCALPPGDREIKLFKFEEPVLVNSDEEKRRPHLKLVSNGDSNNNGDE